MKIAICLLLALLIFGIFKTQRTVTRSRNAEERFFVIRAFAFTWLVAIALLGALFFLPGRLRILFLLPAFIIVISLAKFGGNGRARLRQELDARIDLERMKRVH